MTLSRCNVAMVRSHDEQEMLEEVCRAIVQSGGMALAWVGLVDASTGEVLPVASFGAIEANLRYLDGIRITVDAGEVHGRGPTGTAIRDGVPFWCPDFEAEPRTAAWREAAARFGWRASAALPLRRGDKTVGALTFYMTEPNSFDEETRQLLLDIASDVSFGMDYFDREAARASAVDRLRESEERYRLLIDHSQDAILLTAPEGRILSANAAAGWVFRCSESELIASGHASFVDPADLGLIAALEERERSGSFRAEFTLIRRGGERFPAEVSSTSFRDHSGELRSSMIIRDIGDIGEQKRAIERPVHPAQRAGARREAGHVRPTA